MKKSILAILATVAAISASAATEKTFNDKEVLTIDTDTTWNGTTGQSAIDVPSGRTAVINIKKGVTLTVYGADADGTACGMPAIYVPPASTLYITGEGKLVAVGGNGGNGGNGSSGASGRYVQSAYHFNGEGGNGGYGGGGAAAGIGGEGGTGASGGTGGGTSGPRADGDNDDYPANGTDGGTGGDGLSGASCGSVYILGTVTVEVRGGSAGAAGSASISWGGDGHNETGNDDWYAGGGGPGGGGGGGGAAMSIGGGGGGGGAGGGGGSGSFVVTDNENSFYSSSAEGGQGGNGGGGYSGGGGTRTSGEASTYHSNYDSNYGSSKTGAGGTGGNGGSQGNAGSLYKMSTATLTASPARIPSEVTALSGSENEVVNTTVTFKHNSSANVADQTRSASLAFAPPSAPSPAAYEGYGFLGYFTEAEGGTKIYDANLTCVAFDVWPYAENVTLYAHWQKYLVATFMSRGSQVGTLYVLQGQWPGNAPSPGTRTGYDFLGYYTSEDSGTQVFKPDLTPVNSWAYSEDRTLYAHWQRISTVTFMSQGSVVGTAQAHMDQSLPEAPAAESRDGWAFTGYWSEEIGGIQYYDARLQRGASFSWWPTTDDITLYAQWNPVNVPYIITLMSNGEVFGTINARQGTPVESVDVPPSDERSEFKGFFDAPSGGNMIFNANGMSCLAATDWDVIYWDMTLYAHWELAASDITFVSVDEDIGSGRLNLDDTSSIAVPHASRGGVWVFLGYYTAEGEQVFDADYHFIPESEAALQPEIRLYAHWAIPDGSIAQIVYRGQLNLLNGDPATNETSYVKKMHFRVYDSSEATQPLWKVDDEEVTVNADGSFVHKFGDDLLAEMLATGTVTHVGLSIGQNAGTAIEMKPRREIRPVAAVNRALTADGAARDIRIGNLATDNALVAESVTVTSLEVAGTVTAPGGGKVSVTPLTIGAGERTRLMRGTGVKAFSGANPTVLITPSGAILRGQVLATAPSDGVALISSKAKGERALRCPAVVQYCREGESVRAPTSDAGGLMVTFFPFIGKEGR